MIYSQTSEYAIRALAYLSSLGGRPAPAGEIHAKAGVPEAYAAKIFQGLGRARIVGSKSGPHGGYFLRVDPRRLNLLDVIRATEEPEQSPLFNCVMGRSECSDRRPCCLHRDWLKARDALLRTLARVSVADAYESVKVSYRNPRRTGALSKRMQKAFGYARHKAKKSHPPRMSGKESK